MSVTIENTPTIEALDVRWAVLERQHEDWDDRIITVVAHRPRGYTGPIWSVVVRSFQDHVTGKWSQWHVGVINHSRGGQAGEWLPLTDHGNDTGAETLALVEALERARKIARELNA